MAVTSVTVIQGGRPGKRETWDLRRRTGAILVKDPHTSGHQNVTVDFGKRPRPLPLHINSRYTRTGTCVRWGMAVAYQYLYSRYKFVLCSITVLLLKRLRGGRFKSKTATWIQKWFKISVGTSRKLYCTSTHNSFSRRRRRAWL
jgi:hypothetical protein